MEEKQYWKEVWDIEVIDGEGDLKYRLIEKESGNAIDKEHLKECFDHILSEGRLKKIYSRKKLTIKLETEEVSSPRVHPIQFNSMREAYLRQGAEETARSNLARGGDIALAGVYGELAFTIL